MDKRLRENANKCRVHYMSYANQIEVHNRIRFSMRKKSPIRLICCEQLMGVLLHEQTVEATVTFFCVCIRS